MLTLTSSAAVRTAIETMQQLGATVREVDLPHSCYGSSASWSIAYSESFAFHRANFFARSRDYTPAFLHKITGAACLTAEERVTAQRLRQVITAEFLAALAEVDAIVTPTTAYAAYPIGGTSPQADMRSLTRPVSLTGLPGPRRAVRFYKHRSPSKHATRWTGLGGKHPPAYRSCV